MNKTKEKQREEPAFTAALYVRTEQPTHQEFMSICHANGIDASALVRSMMKSVVAEGSLKNPLFEPLLHKKPAAQDKPGRGRKRRPAKQLEANPQ